MQQTIQCEACKYRSTTPEAFTVLQLPIDCETDCELKKVHIKVIYLFECVTQRYDLFLRPGRYQIAQLKEKIKQIVDRPAVKSGKRTVLLAELKQGHTLLKLFTETSLMFNFTPGQELTTYAYETDKKSLCKLAPYNFIHVHKE